MQTVSCTKFDVNVVPVPDNNQYTRKPDFLINLRDQRVKVGEPLMYSMGDGKNIYGERMDVKA